MDDNTTMLDDDEEIEALSLSDFPLTNEEQDRQFSFESTDYFEFLTGLSSDLTTPISHAEDIMFSGKLIPLDQQPQSQSNSLSSENQNQNHTDDYRRQSFHQRRCESLSELKSSRSSSTEAQLVRNSRSLNCRKLRRTSSMNNEVLPEIRRNTSCRNLEKYDIKVVKPRWYILTFGSVKFPPEMDLRDMKNRLVRRSEVPANRSERKCSSRWLRVLSCKGSSSVAVATSYSPCISTS
ncbi:hypothetical protein LguiB_020834 [Lonicera macranthoides]